MRCSVTKSIAVFRMQCERKEMALSRVTPGGGPDRERDRAALARSRLGRDVRRFFYWVVSHRETCLLGKQVQHLPHILP